MTPCEYLDDCPFFNDRMQGMDATAEVMKSILCQDDCSSCARFMVRKTLGKKHVPPDLFPRQQERAKRMIKSHV